MTSKLWKPLCQLVGQFLVNRERKEVTLSGKQCDPSKAMEQKKFI